MGWLRKRVTTAISFTARIAAYRAAAEQLRLQDPERYARIVSDAGPASEELVRDDPDAYVALVLAQDQDDRGYRVAFRVDHWRATAEHMRLHDEEFYALILAQVVGTGEEEAARRDPDAYAALHLSEQADKYARQLQAENPERYAEILALATGDDEQIVRLDPDAYVAVFLAEEEEDEAIRSAGTGGL